MKDTRKTKKQLVVELAELRQRINELEAPGKDSVQAGSELQQIKNLSSFLGNISDIIVITDTDGTISFVNPSIERVLGYRPEKLINRNISDILHPDDLPGVMNIYSQGAKNTYQAMSSGCRFKHKDGSWRTSEMIFKNFFDDTNAGDFIMIYRDITESRRAQESMEKAAREWITTFDSITDMVSIQDRNFRIVRVNKSFANALGTTPDKLIGKTCYEVIHQTKEPLPDCPHRQTLLAKKPTRVEFFEPSLAIDVEVSTSPIFSDGREVVRSVHIIQDITESKRAKEEIDERTRALEQKIQEITALNVLFQDHLNIRFKTEESFNKLIESIQHLSFEAHQLLEVRSSKGPNL